MANVSAWMDQAREHIEGWIAEDLAQMDNTPGTVDDAMRYSLEAGGKRLRPQLVLAAGEYVGVEWPRLKPAALAIEYLHTYSLIHDDLPAMDNDDLRRGRPTSHKIFGDAMAILAGDALLTEAFWHMTALLECGFDAGGVARSIRRLALSAGRQGLVRGQVQDLAAENQDITAEALVSIHEKKTAALFVAALEIPAILAGDARAVDELGRFGRHFGLAFQMVDDILNVIGDSQQLGKATGTDAGLGKATYPRLLGLDGARKLLREHADFAAAGLDPDRSGTLEALLRFAVERTW